MGTTEKIILVISIYLILVNAVSRLYYKYGNHNWSRFGYKEHSPIYAISIISNVITFIVIAIMLGAYLIEWINK